MLLSVPAFPPNTSFMKNYVLDSYGTFQDSKVILKTSNNILQLQTITGK